MAYNQFTKDSGGTADDRRAEADRIIKILMDSDMSEFTPKEIQFVNQMDGNAPVSTKQLFWLRDLKDKYL